MNAPLTLLVVGSTALSISACGSDTGASPTETPEPATYQIEHFDIVDQTGAPQGLIDSLSVALETEWGRVGELFPEFVPPGRITFNLRSGNGIPFVTPAENSMNQWENSLAFNYFPHQLTHLWTRYTRRAFLEEGIAVYVTEVLVPDAVGVNPYRGQPPHAWVSLFDRNGTLVSLFSAYRAGNFSFSVSGSAADASAWQIFVEAGSFTRWVMDTRGRDVWFELFRTDNLGTALGASTVDLELAWLQAVRDSFPDPLPCEDAISPAGSREAFWCARARGQ